jgi:hypothetical protein
MEQRVSVVTLGVDDLKCARGFYEALGWRSSTPAELEVVFFQAGGMVLALWDREKNAKDSGAVISREPGETFWGGYSGRVRQPRRLSLGDRARPGLGLGRGRQRQIAGLVKRQPLSGAPDNGCRSTAPPRRRSFGEQKPRPRNAAQSSPQGKRQRQPSCPGECRRLILTVMPAVASVRPVPCRSVRSRLRRGGGRASCQCMSRWLRVWLGGRRRR